MHADKKPCTTCPYKTTTPSGVWSHDEYEKLRPYDGEWGDGAPLASFLCHKSETVGGDDDKLCRGWLSVHSESFAVRLLITRGGISGEVVYAEPEVELHPTGAAAADYGQRDLDSPSTEAVTAATRLSKMIARRGH